MSPKGFDPKPYYWFIKTHGARTTKSHLLCQFSHQYSNFVVLSVLRQTESLIGIDQNLRNHILKG
jgi:hypothetical protein